MQWEENGFIKLSGKYAKVSVIWEYEALRAPGILIIVNEGDKK